MGLPYHDSSFSLFSVMNSTFSRFLLSLHRCAEIVMANQVPVIPDVQKLQDALAVPPAQAGAAQNQAQDTQIVDGGEQPAAVAVPAAQPVHAPDADVVSCSCLLLAYLLSFYHRSLACFAGCCSIVSRFPAYVFCEFVSIIALLLEAFIASLSRPSWCIESVPLFFCHLPYRLS